MRYKIGDFYKEYKIKNIECQPRVDGSCECILFLDKGLSLFVKAKKVNEHPLEIEVIV